MDKYYLMTLFNPATPSFVTLDTNYFANKNQIIDFLQNIEDTELKEKLEKWLKTKDMDISYVYDEKLLQELQDNVLQADYRHIATRFQHENTYGYYYYIKFDEIKGKLYYFQKDSKWHRAYIIRIEDLKYSSKPSDQEARNFSMTWGNGNIVLDGSSARNIMGYIDKEFSSQAEVTKDIQNPEEIDLRYFFDDIFADG